jgi:GWxTD domain-containing protein
VRLLETWVATPLAGAVGWTLLHSLWEGAIIAAALAASLLAIRSPRARYAAACVALLAMVAAFGFTLVRMAPDTSQAMQAVREPAFPAWKVQNGLDASGHSHLFGFAAVLPWVASLWIAGVWIFYLWHVAAWISICRLRRRGVCCAPERWQQHLGRLSAQLRLSRPIRLLESCLVDAPIVLGHFRPVILMPIGLLAGLPAGQVEAILLHELAHIRRCDYLVNLLQRAAGGLLFYHPAVWWMCRVIRTERENCCDDVVVAMSGDAHEYAVALAALEENRASGREPALAATGGNLMKRIRRLLNPKKAKGAWTPLFAAVLAVSIAGLALVAALQAAPPPQEGSVAAKQQRDRAATSPYMKWLNEDVVYIISDQERAAYQNLTSDPEREKFIEQFWLRRNPRPGAVVNDFTDEHYRRIAYANRKFQTASGRPGWQTDRGHMYIIYGPPDEKEGHPAGGPQKGYPYELWMYRHLDGIGDNVTVTFIDPTGTGDYRVAPGNGR